jgi:SHS2 domain-containing protein
MKKEKKGYEFLEHTADVYIAAHGRTLAEAFENAALAMFETMTDTEWIKPKVEETVKAEGQDKQALLYSWLEQLLLLFDLNGLVLSRFKVSSIEKAEDMYKLVAKVYGEPFDPKRHKQKVGVKAVTYHRMEIKEFAELATVKFILDI